MAVLRVHESVRHLLSDMLTPIRDGSALPAGWRLDDWEAEQGISLILRAGPRELRIELEAPDATRPCFARTKRFNIYYTVYYTAVNRDRRDSDDAERAVLESVVRVVREREGLLPPPKDAGDAGGKVQVREVEVDRALVREGDGAYYLNPYVGCMLACPFCYAQHRADFSRSLEGLPHSAWGKWVDVKVNAPAVLREEVKRLEPGLVRMSPIITDPYQTIERRYRITRGCLEAMEGTAFSPIVLTRASLVLEDLGLLTRCRAATVGMSVPTDDDAIREAFEPGTEPVETRLSTLRELHAAGLRTFAVIQPLLPMNPDRLVELLAPHVAAIRIGPLFEKPRAAPIFARLGRLDALEESWERATYDKLVAAFRRHGVPVNPEGPEWAFLR